MIETNLDSRIVPQKNFIGSELMKVCMIACMVGLTWLVGPAFSEDDLAGLWKPREGRSMRVTSTARLKNGKPNPDSNSDNFRVPPGQTHVLADLKGPGVIRHLWLTFLGPKPHPWHRNGAATPQEMLIRIYWDGRETPDVEAPVGDFFAAGFGRRMEVRSLPVQVENGAGYNCFWPMPFRKSARIEIVNDGKKEIALLYYNLDWQKVDSLPEDTPYFCARYRQEYPVRKGVDYLVLVSTCTLDEGGILTIFDGTDFRLSWFDRSDVSRFRFPATVGSSGNGNS